jgi:hypothetical protein
LLWPLAPHTRATRAYHSSFSTSTLALPSTGRTTGVCPGYVHDHIIPLCKGGPDTPANMQWQTKAAAKDKDKDKWECR